MKHALVLLALAACSSPSKSGTSRPSPPPPPDDFKKPDGENLNVRPGATHPVIIGGDNDEDGLHVVGAIPKDSIHRVVRENFASIRQCYEQLVMANPGLQGRVIAKFKVAIDGTVQDASATGVHPDLETCVATQVRKFKFPRPDKGDVLVEYPFTFKPG
jgi:hypothetical protein